MKYIEELLAGNTFSKDNKFFLLTSDFKKNNSRLAYCLTDGNPTWLNGSDIVDELPIYYLDDANNVAPIKPIHDTPTNIY